MRGSKDNLKLGDRYQIIVEGRHHELLEEGIKDSIFAGLMGLIAMSPLANAPAVDGVENNKSGIPNKKEVHQVIQQADTSLKLTMACVEVFAKTIEFEMRMAAKLKAAGGDTTDLEKHIDKLMQKMKAIEMAAERPKTALKTVDMILSMPSVQ